MIKSITNKILKKGDKSIDLIFFISVIVATGLWAFYIFNKLAIISEGWYITYAKMILAGKIPYRDFELVFPPLNTYFHVIVILIFGESLIVLRVCGALLFIGIAIIIYRIFKLLFPSFIAAIATLIAIFIQQSEAVNIMYDYGRFFDFFNNLSFFLLLRIIIKSYKKEKININFNIFLVGIFSSIALLYRQSSGLIVFFYFFVFIIVMMLYVEEIKIKFKSLVIFLFGFLIPIFILFFILVLTNSLVPFIEMNFLTDSKGSIWTVLFNWIPRWIDSNTKNDFVLLFTFIISLFFIFCFSKKTKTEVPSESKSTVVIYFSLLIIVLFFTIALLKIEKLTNFFTFDLNLLVAMMFTINLVVFLFFLKRAIKKVISNKLIESLEVSYIFFGGFIIAVGFGCGTSFSLALGQSSLNFGFIFALFIQELFKIKFPKFNILYKNLSYLLAFILITTTLAQKINKPYSWIGLTAEKYSQAKFTSDMKYLKGIKITENEKNMYEDFLEKTRKNLGKDDEIYCYSQISIFYSLAERIPNVKSVNPWIDVSRDKTILNDLEYLKNNNPKMILFADHGMDFMNFADNMFRGGKESGNKKLYEWLLEREEQNYNVISNYLIQEYKVYLLLRID